MSTTIIHAVHASTNLHDYLNPCLSELTKACFLNFIIIFTRWWPSCNVAVFQPPVCFFFFTLTCSIHTSANAIKVQKLRVVDTCI